MTDKIRKIMGISLFILAFSLVWSGSNVRAQSCLTPPSCDTLGYKQSEDDCSGMEQVLKCPFDQTKMFCVDTTTQILQVGAILYSDKTFSSDVVTGKTPIGVVFDVNKRLAVTLEQSGLMPWGVPTGIYSFPNCDVEERLSCGTDGKTNTAAIIAFGKTESWEFPAAEYCNEYKTPGTEAGDWFLPSYSQLWEIYQNKDRINATLQKLGKPAMDGTTWSSTQVNLGLAMMLDVSDASYFAVAKPMYAHVRPVLAF